MSVTNTEILCMALHQCGGDIQPVDTEDIAMQANKIAPGRFAWKKFPDQVNLEYVRVQLSNAKKEKNGVFVTGSGSKGWMLNAEGLALATSTEVQEVYTEFKTTGVSGSRDEKWKASEKKRLPLTQFAQQLNEDSNAEVSSRTLQAFFRITPYGSELDIQRKIDRYVNTLGKDETVGDLILTAKDRWYKLTSKEID